MKKFVMWFSAALLTQLIFAKLAHATDFFAAPQLVVASSPSVQVLPQDTQRKYLLVINTGSQPVILNPFGAAQIGSEGVPIPVGGAYEPSVAPSNACFLKATATTSTVTIITGH